MTTSYQRILRANLTSELMKQEFDQSDVAIWIDRTQGAVSNRMRGTTDFQIGELVTIAAHLRIPLSKLIAGIETQVSRDGAEGAKAS